MKIEEKNLSYFFDNIKDGDAIFFYHKQWWAFASKIISLFTGGKVDHVGVCLSVIKTGSAAIFQFSEQTFTHGGCLRPYSIFRIGNQYSLRGFSANSIIYGKLKTDLNDQQKEIILNDAKDQVGKKYGKHTLLKTLNWYDSIFSKKQSALDTLRVCSTHAQILYKKAGLISEENFKKDDFYNPFELMNSGLFDLYMISDYKQE